MGEPACLRLEQFVGFLRWTAVRAYDTPQCRSKELRELALLQWMVSTAGYAEVVSCRGMVNLQRLQLKLDGLDLGGVDMGDFRESKDVAAQADANANTDADVTGMNGGGATKTTSATGGADANDGKDER